MNPKKIFAAMMALVAATFFISLAPAFGEVDTDWVRRYNGPGNFRDYANDLTADTSGNVYVTGYSYGSGRDRDYATIKHISSHQPSITVISPNGGEFWQAGLQYDITWSSHEFTGNVSIYYSLSGEYAFDSLIVSGYANTGEYPWTIPLDSRHRMQSYDCKVGVCATEGCDPADASNDYFTIWICGDCNLDNDVDAADVVFLLNHLFVPPPGMPPIPLPESRADVNGDGIVDGGDIVMLLNYLFVPPPGVPSLECPRFGR